MKNITSELRAERKKSGRVEPERKKSGRIEKGLSHPGAVHADLTVSGHDFRYRPERLSSDDLGFELSCCFEVDGREIGPLRVLNVSPTGLGVALDDTLMLARGALLHRLEVRYKDAVVYRGDATCVYQVEEPEPRLGLSFSGFFDLKRLRLHGSLVVRNLLHELAVHRRQIETLPVPWRAAIADLRQLLLRLKTTLEDIENSFADLDRASQVREEEHVIESVFEAWSPHFYRQVSELHHMSAELPREVLELARGYATSQLMPLLYPCPMHSRAYEKPRGYAGDYLYMTLYFGAPRGKTLYARVLHYVSQRYTLSRMVVHREKTMRDTIHAALRSDRPARIISLACGPAIEMRNFVSELETLEQPLSIFLIDQDEGALSHSHDALRRALDHPDKRGLPVDLQHLHFSVRQLIKPRDASEKHVVESLLKDIDLIYSAGLYDYLPEPVAKILTSRLYDLLRPGGKLFLGNLCVAPDTTWTLEFVLSWHLIYRTPESMLRIAEGLEPKPEVRIVTDGMDACLFLEVTKP